MHFFRLKQLTVAILQPLPVNSFLCQFALFANLSQVSSVLLPYICKLFVRSSCYFFLKTHLFSKKRKHYELHEGHSSDFTWLLNIHLFSNLFPKNMRVQPNIENSIKLTPFRVHLGPNETNHSLHVPAISKTKENISPRYK